MDGMWHTWHEAMMSTYKYIHYMNISYSWKLETTFRMIWGLHQNVWVHFPTRLITRMMNMVMPRHHTTKGTYRQTAEGSLQQSDRIFPMISPAWRLTLLSKAFLHLSWKGRVINISWPCECQWTLQDISLIVVKSELNVRAGFWTAS